MATVRLYYDVEVADNTQSDEEDYDGYIDDRQLSAAIAALRAEIARPNPQIEGYPLCGEQFYGMGYSANCTKAAFHEGECSTIRS